MKLALLLAVILLGSCASEDPLAREMYIQERYEALVIACKRAGGTISLKRHSATRSKLDLPPTRWEKATAQCVRLN